MNTCKHKLVILEDKRILCKAYFESKRPDGLHWAHYPECKNENCPLKHPVLLKGAILKEEGK